MTNSTLERSLIVYFRLAMGWTFLYAASHQVFDANWTVVGSETISMGQKVFVGLAVTSHQQGLVNSATFDNVSVA